MKLVDQLRNRLELWKIRDYRKIDGWLSPGEALALYQTAGLLPEGSLIVEIGSWKGKSTYCLARGLAEGRVVAIDPFDASGEEGSREIYEQTRGTLSLLDQFQTKMRRLGVLDRIDVRKGRSRDFAGQFPKIDFLFIDGDHSREASDYDYTAYQSFIPPGGFIALHDYDPERKELGPTWVIENRILPSGRYECVRNTDSLWVGRKK